MENLNILVVDDDHDAAMGLGDLFEIEGHRVTLAFNGREAVDQFARTDFDVAFMDVMMPGMNGVEALLEIRKLRPNAKVVIMTGFSLDVLLERAAAGGAVAVLNKPLEPIELIETLADVDAAGAGENGTHGHARAPRNHAVGPCGPADGRSGLAQGPADTLVPFPAAAARDAVSKESGETGPGVLVPLGHGGGRSAGESHRLGGISDLSAEARAAVSNIPGIGGRVPNGPAEVAGDSPAPGRETAEPSGAPAAPQATAKDDPAGDQPAPPSKAVDPPSTKMTAKRFRMIAKASAATAKNGFGAITWHRAGDSRPRPRGGRRKPRSAP